MSDEGRRLRAELEAAQARDAAARATLAAPLDEEALRAEYAARAVALDAQRDEAQRANTHLLAEVSRLKASLEHQETSLAKADVRASRVGVQPALNAFLMAGGVGAGIALTVRLLELAHPLVRPDWLVDALVAAGAWGALVWQAWRIGRTQERAGPE